MSGYRYLAVDLLSNTVREEVPLSGMKLSRSRNRAGGFEASIQLRHPKATRANLDPGRTLIVAERNNQIVGHGVLWGAQPENDLLKLTGASLWSLFSRRYVTETRTYSSVAQETIATDLVDWAQGNGSLTYGGSVGDSQGDLGVTTAVSGSGPTRDRTYEGFRLKNIAEAIEELSSVIDGFDFDLETRWSDGPGSTIDRVFTTYYPKRGRRTETVLELGTNIEAYSLQVNAGAMAIRVFGVGEGEGADMIQATATDAPALGVYPLVEDVASHKDVSVQSTLDDHARAVLNARKRPITRPNLLNVRLGAQLQLGSWVIGDEVTLRIDDGWTSVDSIYRINGWDLTVDQDGKEVVSMDLVETEAA